MSGPIRNRISASILGLREVQAIALPAIPEVVDPTQRDVLNAEALLREIKSLIDEFDGYIEEIRIGRDDWSKLMTKVTAAERPAEEALCNQFFVDQRIDDASQRARVRIRELKALESLCIMKVDQYKGLVRAAEAELARQQQLEQQRELLNLQAAARPDPVAAAGAVRSVALPALKLKPYYGPGMDPSFCEFWELFRVAVHDDVSLAGARKLVYLKSLLHNEPKLLVDRFDITDRNYADAVSLLKTRYGSEEAVVRDLHAELLRLKPSERFSDDVKLQLAVERICNSLAHLGQDVNSPSIWLALQQKVSKPVLREILIKKATDQAANPGAAWNTQTFRETFALVVQREQAVIAVYEQERLETKDKKKDKKKQGHSSVFAAATETKQDPKHGSKEDSGRRKSKKALNGNGKNRQYAKGPMCAFCKNNHWSSECETYQDLSSRIKRLRELNACLKCLKDGHWANACKAKARQCFYCKCDGHNKALCRKKFERATQTSNSTTGPCQTVEAEPPKVQAVATAGHDKTCTLFLCAEVQVFSPWEPKHKAKAVIFFDSGCEKSYISRELMNKLKLKTLEWQSFDLVGIGGKELGRYEGALTRVGISAKNFSMVCNVNQTEGSVLHPLHKVQLDDIDDQTIQQLRLKKVLLPWEVVEPDLLIGMDQFNQFEITPVEKLSSGFWLSKSRVGPMVNGKGVVKGNPSPILASMVTEGAAQMKAPVPPNAQCLNDNDAVLTELVRRNFEAETIGLGEAKDLDEEEFWLQEFTKSISFNGTRYEVGLPWNDLQSELPSNYKLALGRLNSTLKRLREKPEILKKYHDTIVEQLERGIIEEAPPRDWRGVVHYLPHREVIREDKSTTKLRVVYDASAKYRKDLPSLNDCLFKGPNLLKDLAGVLMRARTYPVLFVSDIEKAFLQIEIRPPDRNAVRFLWLKEPQVPGSELVMYRFTRVAFGVICSPAQLATTLKYHLEKYESKLAKDVMRDLYVDNVIVGLSKSNEISRAYTELKQMFADAGMNVREFASNALQEIKELPEADRAPDGKMKVLGVEWNRESDTLSIKLPSFPLKGKVTRRSILAHIAKPFDPLGLSGPLLLKAKLFLQKVVKEVSIKWDEVVPEQVATEWREIVHCWNDAGISVPRLYSNVLKQSESKCELHVFADASGYGLGAAVYLRMVDEAKGLIDTQLIFGKSLVKPSNISKKHDTIPKLELQALVIATNSAHYVRKQLSEALGMLDVRMWTDSMDVVDWMRSGSRHEKMIENRLRKVRCFPTRHIAGVENPADLASRGVENQSLSECWFKGPPWLREMENKWPESQRAFDPGEDRVKSDPPLYEISMVNALTNKNRESLIDVSRFSQYARLLRATAYFIRAVSSIKMQKKVKRKKEKVAELICLIPQITTEELDAAEIFIIKETQSSFPPDEKAVITLRIYADEHGVLRCKGRIAKSKLPAEAVDPIYMPRKSPLTTVILLTKHREIHHAGIECMVSAVRIKYWIPQIRRQINSVINVWSETKCLKCARYKAKPYSVPPQPQLPIERVQAERPFQNTGVDYFGPLLLKGNKKVWCALFTCMVCRAIHLELVADCTAESFLQAFRRFIARRGTPNYVISDNGSNFKLGSKVLKEIYSTVDRKHAKSIYESASVKNFAANKGFRWSFITERAAWQGGFYERMVGLVKYPLRRSIGKKKLTEEQLNTLLIEIERIVNERPLCYLSEREVVRPIRPIDFLIPYANYVPDPILERFDEEDEDYVPNPSSRETLVNKYRRTLESANQFWSVWIENYLTSLREKMHGERKKGDNFIFPKVGELVIVHDYELPRSQWRLGRVVELITSADGEVRSAKVRVANKGSKEQRVWTRATKHLYPLECQEGTLEITETKFLESNAVFENKSTNNKSIISLAMESLQIAIERPPVEEESEIVEIVSSSKEQHLPRDGKRIRAESMHSGTSSSTMKRSKTYHQPSGRYRPLITEVKLPYLPQLSITATCNGHPHCRPFRLLDCIADLRARGPQSLNNIIFQTKDVDYEGKSLLHIILAFAALNNAENVDAAISFIHKSTREYKYRAEKLIELFKENQQAMGKRGKAPALWSVSRPTMCKLLTYWIDGCQVAGTEVEQSDEPCQLHKHTEPIMSELEDILEEAINVIRCKDRIFVNTPIALIGDANASILSVAMGKSFCREMPHEELGRFIEQDIYFGPKVRKVLIVTGGVLIAEKMNVKCYMEQLERAIKALRCKHFQAFILPPPTCRQNTDGWCQCTQEYYKLKDMYERNANFPKFTFGLIPRESNPLLNDNGILNEEGIKKTLEEMKASDIQAVERNREEIKNSKYNGAKPKEKDPLFLVTLGRKPEDIVQQAVSTLREVLPNAENIPFLQLSAKELLAQGANTLGIACSGNQRKMVRERCDGLRRERSKSPEVPVKKNIRERCTRLLPSMCGAVQEVPKVGLAAGYVLAAGHNTIMEVLALQERNELLKVERMLQEKGKLVIDLWPQIKAVAEVAEWLKPRYKYGKLVVVGSVGTGVSGECSDVDTTLIVNRYKSFQKEGMIGQLKEVSKLLNGREEVKEARWVPAKVPVLKVKFNNKDVEMDITFQNLTSVRNTGLMKAYVSADPRVKSLFVNVKEWAKKSGINDASKGTLNSYSLLLMCVHFLQNCQPPILPYIQREKPNVFGKDAELRWPEEVSNYEYDSKNAASVVELWLSWFLYFANFRFEEMAISVEEKSVERSGKTAGTGDDHMVIIEPYDSADNVARAVNEAGYRKIVSALETARKKISQSNTRMPCVNLPRWLMWLVTLVIIMQIFGSGVAQMVCYPGADSSRVLEVKPAELLEDERGSNSKREYALEIFRYDPESYVIDAYHCSKVRQQVKFRTDLFNYPYANHSQTKYVTSVDECERMIKLETCSFGNLYAEKNRTWHTAKTLNVKFTYFSIGWSTAKVDNCYLKPVKLIAKPASETIEMVTEDTQHCKYSDGHCMLIEGDMLSWNVDLVDPRRCLLKSVGTYSGSVSKKYWISETGELALTFKEKPEVMKDCNTVYAVSEQGFAIRMAELSDMMHRRTKREADGIVLSSQLAAELTAASIQSFRSVSARIGRLGQLLKVNGVGLVASTYGGATLAARRWLKVRLIQARPIGEKFLEIWPCRQVYNISFSAVKGQRCFHNPPVNGTLSEGAKITGFIDPVTSIIQASSNEGPCEIFGDMVVEFENEKLMRVNQRTGKVREVKITRLNLDGPIPGWAEDLQKMGPQIFHAWVLKNVSEGQRKMLELLRQFQLETTAANSARMNVEKESIWGEIKEEFSWAGMFPSGWDLFLGITGLCYWARIFVFEIWPWAVAFGERHKIKGNSKNVVVLAPTIREPSIVSSIGSERNRRRAKRRNRT